MAPNAVTLRLVFDVDGHLFDHSRREDLGEERSVGWFVQPTVHHHSPRDNNPKSHKVNLNKCRRALCINVPIKGDILTNKGHDTSTN